MSSTRPDPSLLERVDDDEVIYRLFPLSAYWETAPDGQRLQTAAFPSGDFNAAADNYGASVYVHSRLPNGVVDLETAHQSWRAYGFITVQVRELAQFGVTVCYSPQDCIYGEPLASAHASIIGLTRKKRDDLVEFLQVKITRTPTPSLPP